MKLCILAFMTIHIILETYFGLLYSTCISGKEGESHEEGNLIIDMLLSWIIINIINTMILMK